MINEPEITSFHKNWSAKAEVDEVSELCYMTEDVFEELGEDKRPDMLLRFKDWAYAAIQNRVDYKYK